MIDRSELQKIVLPTVLVSVVVSTVSSLAVHSLMANVGAAAPNLMSRPRDQTAVELRDDVELASIARAAIDDVQEQVDALRARLDASDKVRVPAVPEVSTEFAELKAKLASLERGKTEVDIVPRVRAHVEGGETSIDHVLEARRKRYELTDVQIAGLRSLELEFLRRDERLLADWERGCSSAAFCGAVRDAETEYQSRFEALLTGAQLEKRRSDVKQYGARGVARYLTR